MATSFSATITPRDTRDAPYEKDRRVDAMRYPVTPHSVEPRMKALDVREVVVLSSQGGMLDVDPASGSPIQLPCRFEPGAYALWDYDGTTLRWAGSSEHASATTWRVQVVDGKEVAFETGPGRFLRAFPLLGAVSLDAAAPLAWERFRLLSVEDYQLIARCAEARWVVGDDAQPTRPGSLTFIEGFRVRFADRVVALDDFLEAIMRGQPRHSPDGLPMSFMFFHGTCTAEKAFLFNPLIYSAVAGPPHFLEQLAICFGSFETFGLYDGSYRVVCDRERQDVSPYFKEISDTRWDCIRRKLDKVETIVSERMNILQETDLDGFQPILYIDSDVICDRPVEGLLIAALKSDRILIATEFPQRSVKEVGSPHGNWFGLFLYGDDPMAARHECINNGIFAARNRQVVAQPFAVVAESWKRFKSVHQDAHRAAYDQPFYGYVLQYLDMVDTAAMNAWVNNLQGHEPSGSYEPIGLTHFNIGVGMDKTAAMQRYLGLLEERLLPAPSAVS